MPYPTDAPGRPAGFSSGTWDEVDIGEKREEMGRVERVRLWLGCIV